MAIVESSETGLRYFANAKVTHDIPVPEIFDKGIIIIKLSLVFALDPVLPCSLRSPGELDVVQLDR